MALNSNWDTDDFNNAENHLNKQVTRVYICAYKNENNEGADGLPPTNHWATFLQTGNPESIRLDMAPGYGTDGTRGKIRITMQDYIYTYDAIKTLGFDVVRNTMAQEFCDAINERGRERYNFTNELEGCRYWIYTILSDWESRGLLAEGTSTEAWAALSLYWRNPSGSEERTVAQGTFRN